MATRTDSAAVTARISTRGILARYPLPLFFTMAYVFTWLAVSPMILSRAGLIRLDLPVELVQIVGALAGPALAGVIVTAGTEGRAGVGRLLRRVIQWKVGVVWYLVLLLGPLAVLTLTAGAFLGVSFLRDFLYGLPLLPAQYLPFVLVGVIFGPLWEEIGWRGVALPRLQRTLGPVSGDADPGRALGRVAPSRIRRWLARVVHSFVVSGFDRGQRRVLRLDDLDLQQHVGQPADHDPAAFRRECLDRLRRSVLTVEYGGCSQTDH